MGEEVPHLRAGRQRTIHSTSHITHSTLLAGGFRGRSPLGEGVLEDPAETGLQVGGGVPLPTSSGGLTPKIEKNAEKT